VSEDKKKNINNISNKIHPTPFLFLSLLMLKIKVQKGQGDDSFAK